MAISKIYNPNEFESLASHQLQQKAQEIKQRFDLRRNFYHSLKNNLFDIELWTKLNQKLTEFDSQKFPAWNNQWNNIYRNVNAQNYINYFNQGVGIFEQFESDIELHKFVNHSPEIESLKTELLNKIDSDMVTIKNSIIESVNLGIQNLINLKAELGLSKNFAENLEKDKSSANIIRFATLILFVLSLLSIGVWILISYNLEFLKALSSYEKIAIRLSVSITLAFLSYFFFSQFKIYQLLHLKYSHLSNFLGGGATYISQLIGQDAEVSKITNQKLADMFMEIDDMMNSIKKTKHPSETTVDSGNKILGTVLDKVSDIAKSVKEIKSP